MRRYLAMQAMESGKSIGTNFLGRAGGLPYGSGMLLNTDASSSKVGKWHRKTQTFYTEPQLTTTSDSSLRLPFIEHWQLETSWPKCHGSRDFLFAREVLRNLLHQ